MDEEGRALSREEREVLEKYRWLASGQGESVTTQAGVLMTYAAYEKLRTSALQNQQDARQLDDTREAIWCIARGQLRYGGDGDSQWYVDGKPSYGSWQDALLALRTSDSLHPQRRPNG